MTKLGALLLSVALLAGTQYAVSGCGRTVTPAELAEQGTRSYPGQASKQVFRATNVALKTLGYNVVVADEASGRLKTAPKVVMVRAYGNSTSATAVESSLGWSLEVSDAKDGASVHAEPHPFQNGQSLEATQMSATYVERAFNDLFKEIDSNLPKAAAAKTVGGGKP